MIDQRHVQPDPHDDRPGPERDDDAAEIRFSLTALGEAVVVERRVRRFRGFGPCSVATLPTAG